MSAKVVLQLGSGDWQQGFPFVTLELWNQYKRLTRWTGSLPPCFELSEAYREWQNLYEALCNGWPGWRSDIPPEFELDEEVIDRASPETFAQVSQEIKNYVNEWLDTQSFSHLEEQLRSELHANDEVQFIIETEDPQLRKFPWHLWNFFDDFPYAESALSPWESREHNSYSKVKGKVRILAIFGNSHGIDIDKDRNFLEQLPPKETDIKFLVKPEYQELYDYLWDKMGWDILFFA